MFNLDNIFMYHPPNASQMVKYEAIRSAAKTFAQVMTDNTPEGADQSAAMRHLRECVMTANAAVALEGKL